MAKLVPPMLQSAIMNAVIIRWSAIIFLGIWSTDIEAGYFSAASRVAIALSLALVTTNAVAAPRLAKQFANGEIAAVAITSSTATAFALLIASPIFFLCFFLPSWTMSLFGQEFVSAGNVLLVLVAGELMNVLVGPVGTLLQMSGYERVYRNCTIASAMLQVALCIFLIPKFGAMGAAIATASALFLTNLLAFLFTYKLLAVLPLPFVAARVRVRR
ncbi:hypothetical protein GWN49_04260 [Candidatus Bathyarchaeota archaeon]|nr:hypothetical protein [Phycisphaerae bacterium]NIP51646.1 hypothetical protein [Phycisphaerae bacterium]NIV44083.1 hypothetical protein [Candidatus Bathyarchaeota archaeon]NIX28218.1 hypothetical protein [Phycisphaerae bacterium]